MQCAKFLSFAPCACNCLCKSGREKGEADTGILVHVVEVYVFGFT